GGDAPIARNNMTTRSVTAARPSRVIASCLAASAIAFAVSCTAKPPADRVRATGQVEATDVQVAAPVGGRLLELRVAEGDRVKAGDTIARLDTVDAELTLARV